MTTLLEQDNRRLLELLQGTVALVDDYLHSIDSRPPAIAHSPRTSTPLPQQGWGAAQALSIFSERYGDQMPASNGPRFWGLVTGGTTPAAMIGDWLTSTFDLNATSIDHSSAANIEVEAIHMLRELFGLSHTFHGVFVTGATMANFTGLAIAREWVAQQYGLSITDNGLLSIPRFQVLTAEAHSSVFKSLVMLGIGRNNVWRLPVLPDQREAIDIVELKQALNSLNGTPCVVVANAGTVNTVDFDDLQAIAQLRSRYPFWLHVDAAFGGYAACSPQFSHLLTGIHEADSITIDAHKWLNVPYDAAMLFTRRYDLQLAVFQNSAIYLSASTEPRDFVHLTPENSRRLRALPAWFTLMAYGREGYQEIVERNCALARSLGEKIDASTHFQLLAPVRMNIVCFTLTDNGSEDRIEQYLGRLREDGRVFLTPTRFAGVFAMRAAISNWRTQQKDLEIAWQAMNECLSSL
jgi:glutamate/tyrosine decarboxylase-like PLP-dependent enzyme